MKIYTMVSPSHEPLLDGWLKTSNRDPLFKPVVDRCPIASDGDYMNAQWNEISIYGTNLFLKTIKDNIGSIIGVCGVDVRFIRPFIHDVYDLFSDHDVLFQRERADDSFMNPDVSFWRCTEKLYLAWVEYIELFKSFDGTLSHQNELMKKAFRELKLGLLPHRYASTDNGGINNDPVLFHANCLPPPDSVRKKLESLARFS